MDIIEVAERIARDLHAGQTRRDGKTPYFSHAKAVADRVPDAFKPAAFLHDVIENCGVDADWLLAAGVPREVVDTVSLLSKQGPEPYLNYIRRLSKNPAARAIKIADIQHNISDAPSPHQMRKYATALLILI